MKLCKPFTNLCLRAQNISGYIQDHLLFLQYMAAWDQFSDIDCGALYPPTRRCISCARTAKWYLFPWLNCVNVHAIGRGSAFTSPIWKSNILIQYINQLLLVWFYMPRSNNMTAYLPFSILEIFNIGTCGNFFHDGEWGWGFGISGRGAGWEQPSGRTFCTVAFVTCWDDLGICPLTVGFEGFTPTMVISGLRDRGSFFS